MTTSLSPAEAAEMQRNGAAIVDIREPDERASGVIPGAQHVPLSALPETALSAPADQPVIYHCRSGRRTLTNFDRLRDKAAGSQVYVIEGGIEAWAEDGLPVAGVTGAAS